MNKYKYVEKYDVLKLKDKFLSLDKDIESFILIENEKILDITGDEPRLLLISNFNEFLSRYQLTETKLSDDYKEYLDLYVQTVENREKEKRELEFLKNELKAVQSTINLKEKSLKNFNYNIQSLKIQLQAKKPIISGADEHKKEYHEKSEESTRNIVFDLAGISLTLSEMTNIDLLKEAKYLEILSDEKVKLVNIPKEYLPKDTKEFIDGIKNPTIFSKQGSYKINSFKDFIGFLILTKQFTKIPKNMIDNSIKFFDSLKKEVFKEQDFKLNEESLKKSLKDIEGIFKDLIK